MIKNLSLNTKGRDFICGDIHGSYSLVEKFLKEVNFDKSADRLICAGDVIDRGPDNLSCIKLFYEPWFFSVMGNHEYMMVDVYAGYIQWLNVWLNNGGNWCTPYFGNSTPEAILVKECVSDIISKLPLLITIDLPDNKKCHVIHAELYSDEPCTDTDFADEEKFRKLACRQVHDGDTILWGRKIYGRLHDLNITDMIIKKYRTSLSLENRHVGQIFGPELSHIYSGHTIIRSPITVYGQTNLDTYAWGAYSKNGRYGQVEPDLWAGLSVTEPATGKFWKVTPSEFTESNSIVII